MAKIRSQELLNKSTKAHKDSARLLKTAEKLKEDIGKASGR